MKKIFTSAFIAMSLALASISASAKEFKAAGNPFVRHIFTADPTARVFDGKLYVYTSHDRDDADYFYMTDWHVFSTKDMENWTDHGAFFSLDDIPWAKSMAWAPDCVERNGKYYFYYPVERTKIGVAVSDSPTSGFKDSGKALVDNSGQIEHIGPEPIDPSVIIHKGQAYMYFGCREFRWCKLKENMTEIDGEIKEMKIIGNEGHAQHTGGYFGEGPFIFKRKNLFYMIYANGWGPKSTLVYATAKHPEGPFTFRGEVMPPVSSFTSHGSVVEYKGDWYIFYHSKDLSGKDYRRSICFDKIYFEKDGSIKMVVPTFGEDLPKFPAKKAKK